MRTVHLSRFDFSPKPPQVPGGVHIPAGKNRIDRPARLICRPAGRLKDVAAPIGLIHKQFWAGPFHADEVIPTVERGADDKVCTLKRRKSSLKVKCLQRRQVAARQDARFIPSVQHRLYGRIHPLAQAAWTLRKKGCRCGENLPQLFPPIFRGIGHKQIGLQALIDLREILQKGGVQCGAPRTAQQRHQSGLCFARDGHTGQADDCSFHSASPYSAKGASLSADQLA